MRQLVSRLLQRRSCYAARRPLRRSARPAVEALEDRTLLSAMPQFNLTNPASGGTFGSQVVVLSSGNIVVTDPTVNNNAGAVYLYDGASGALISTLSGNAGDQLGSGGLTVLTNGNYVVADPAINNNTGAVYLVNGASGAVISTLSGSAQGDQVGSGGVTALTNGNFVVVSPTWSHMGAVTWGSGTTGVSGAVSAANSLTNTDGPPSNVYLGNAADRVTALPDGNYVVSIPFWNGSQGAVTWGNGTSGTVGTASSANSLVSTNVATGSDLTTIFADAATITVLTNGNYLVVNSAGGGYVTWGSATSGVSGTITSANSLVGGADDFVGSGGVTTLPNGNYVVRSPFALMARGAVTWGNGTTGTVGTVSAANSLVGSNAGTLIVTLPLPVTPGETFWVGGDEVGTNVVALANSNYVVSSPSWNGNEGAASWGNGASGTVGTISAANSLVGTTPGTATTFQDTQAGGQPFVTLYKGGDEVSSNGITALTNGNYVVDSPVWGAYVGAVTWGNGTSGSTTGPVSSANSLVGTIGGDLVGSNGVVALKNGNYVVESPVWGAYVGAATWGNGASGTVGLVSASNSLVGSVGGDLISSGGVVPLTNGNYVVVSQHWTRSEGAVTWGNGTTGIAGAVSPINSLVGQPNDYALAAGGVTPLSNGNYVIDSPLVLNQAGAVTFGNGTFGVDGTVNAGNSLMGHAFDQVGLAGISALPNGNYVVNSPTWGSGRGAVTWGNGTTGVIGFLAADNSLIGTTPNGSGGTGGDAIGYSGITVLPDGDYVVISPKWNGGLRAATWVDGNDGTTLDSMSTVDSQNSVVGAVAVAVLNSAAAGPRPGTFVASFPGENGGRVTVGEPEFDASLNGTTPGNGSGNTYTQLVVNGSINIGGARLDLTSIGSFATGQAFVIIKSTLIVGTFAGLPEGAAVMAGGQTCKISYQNNQVTLYASAIHFSPSPLPAGTTGTQYDQTLTGSGGTGPYQNFVVSAGSLPPGLSLSTGGAITGMPTATGAFTFTVQATDSSAAPGPYPGLQTFTLVVTPPGFSYDSSTQVLTITPSGNFNFQYQDGNIPGFFVNTGPPGAVFLLSLPASLLSRAVVNATAGQYAIASLGVGGTPFPQAVRVGNHGAKIQHLDAMGIAHDFLILTGFSAVTASVRAIDQGFLDPTPGVKNVFVSAGNYAYMDSGNNAEHYYEIFGAKFVYGYSSGPGDFAYHYDGSGPSFYVVSGVAYSYMIGTDNGQVFQNYAIGFVFNEGIARHPTQDTATFFDSPGNDQFTGFTYYSSMTSADGTFAENDAAAYFAQVYAYSFVGGFDTATVYNANVNHVIGFH